MSSKKVVFGPRFVGEGIPQILDMRFQITLTSDHVSVVKYKSADMFVGRPKKFLLCSYV